MLCFVNLERRWRSKDRMRYWVLERSVWRMERVSVAFMLVDPIPVPIPGPGPVENALGSEEAAARSSIFSI